MRTIGPVPGMLVCLAACGSSAAGLAPDASTNPDGGALTCGTTIASFCGAHPCDRTLTDAAQDKALCPASLFTCGGYDVVIEGGLDTSTRYYYQGDQLIAIDHTSLPLLRTCTAGPARFEVPSCASPGQRLPACGP
ncbi:MAG TPA: hypothetical protein VFT22_45810 [Kofleriaceae bacterium]|nr:hypothetical protein [Kofleriaceae bacterium]